MQGVTAGAVAPPAGIEALVERFDPDVIDVPRERARIRLEVAGEGAWDALVEAGRLRLVPAAPEQPDALLRADADGWRRVAEDVRGGLGAFRAGRLEIRYSMHLGVGFLAATSGARGPGRLRFHSVRTPTAGAVSVLEAGVGPRALVCVHGLGGTKASFLPTAGMLADAFRVVALDLPGFGESAKPIGARYDAPWFARTVFEAMDALGLERAHLAGNSMGGRVAIEAGLQDRSRIGRLVLLSPALAWLRDRRWAPLARALRPELGLLQITPRPLAEGVVRRLIPGAQNGWAAAGVDEFLRSYLTPRGRAAFYAAARNIYLDEPYGDDGFWTRLGGLECDSLFVWGRHDTLVPVAFRRHVERALARARHVELECGHVPQLERPRETHAAMRDFLCGVAAGR